MGIQLGNIVGKIGGGASAPILDKQVSTQIGAYLDVDVASASVTDSGIYAVLVSFSAINGAANAESFYLDINRGGERLARFVHSSRSNLMSLSGVLALTPGAITLQVLNSSNRQTATVGRVLIVKVE